MASATYTTRSGDTWDAIAFRESGSELLMHHWIDANPAHNYVARFDAGVVLNRPTIVPATPTNLAPWRRP